MNNKIQEAQSIMGHKYDLFVILCNAVIVIWYKQYTNKGYNESRQHFLEILETFAISCPIYSITCIYVLYLPDLNAQVDV